MNPSYIRSRFIQNPVTLECKAVPPHEASRLAAYGWVYISLSAFKSWQVAQWQTRNERYYGNYLQHEVVA